MNQMILKCKMCGGDIEISADMTVGTCQYCGTTMTLPKIDTDKKARLFNRANQYRLNCEFDKSYDAYKEMVSEDETEAEAYWGMLLSEYGVEYVDDPKTGKKVPTCHRTKILPVIENTNYKLACQYADSECKYMYKDEAEVLDRLQKQILSISSRQEPYDVFICYKETDDATGERTNDSVLAQEIYDALDAKGIKTFLSRVSLADKLGVEFEPYIFAALQSAKVMIMVTTDSEHCEAVWVKNEWSRFMGMMEEDKSKVLIPAFKDINVYALPSAFSKYQSQDMNKVGAIQDLVQAVGRIVSSKKSAGRDAMLNQLIVEREERIQKENQLKQKKRKILIAFPFMLIAVILIFLFLIRPIRNNLDNKKALQVIADAQCGDSVSFGNYDQRIDHDNSKEKLYWNVLENDGEKVLLLCTDSIAGMPYNQIQGETNWNNSDVRIWLNDEFYAEAFNKYERKTIVLAQVDEGTNSVTDFVGKVTSEDYVFCLSLDEAKQYLRLFHTRGTPSEIAKSNNIGNFWWFRTPGRNKDYVSCMNSGGKISETGVIGVSPIIGVRPAIWVDISEL